jgi:hypothetical protein
MGKFFKGCLTLMGGLFVLMVMIGVIGNMGRKGNQTAQNRNSSQPESQAVQEAPPAPTLNLRAAEMLKAYENNKLQAEQTYKGKRVRIKGVVGSIGSDILDQPYVTVGTGASFEVTQLQCMFSKEQSGQLAKLNKGQAITVEGTVDAYVMNVLVQDCQLAGK